MNKKEVKLTINEKVITALEGESILKAAADNSIEIPNLCYDGRMEPYGACGLCVVEVAGVPKLLRACSALVSEGMVVDTESERVRECRRTALQLLMSDHEGDCKAPCTLECPAHTECQAYVKQIALGNLDEAIRIIKDKIPLPASIGRICPHPCETKCRRNHVDQPVSIAYLKAFAADKIIEKGGWLPEKAAPSGKSVGIIGGGPAGLSAAYYLALMGHSVTVYDAMPLMGGMLRYGIPEYRLPKKVLQTEIDEIASLGVELKNNVKIGRDVTLPQLREKHNAVLIAIGAWQSRSLGCKGEDLTNVFGGIDFLREVALGNRPAIGEKTAIVGGGNTAMDACRTAVRLGAGEVSVIYRRTRAEMPAEDIEIEEAEQEGVKFRFLTNPDEILGEDGKVCGVRLQHMQLGEPDENGRRRPVPVEGSFEILPLDSIIIATGQGNDNAGFEQLETNRKTAIVADRTSFMTNIEGVFAAGDAANDGAGIAISAIGNAGRAAKAIDAWMAGRKPEPAPQPILSKRDEKNIDFSSKEKIPREIPELISLKRRTGTFDEVCKGLTEEQAQREASRCLECGCHDYGECKLIRYADEYKADPAVFAGDKHKNFTESSLIAIERNQGKCIACGLCVRTCDQLAGKSLLGLVGRAFSTVVKPEFEGTDAVKDCASCHMCVDVCPTGALKIIEK